MTMQLKYNQEEFQQLISSSSSYMSRIEAYSQAFSDYSLQQQLLCLQHCSSILEDQSIPIIKKLFVFRFIKDALILASLSFYECVIIKIFPWLIKFSACFKSVVEQSKVAEAGRMLRGSKPLPVAEISVCKNIINLIQDILKWMGTHIQNHPYSPIQFRSAFRLLLEKHPQIMNKKLTDLTFFKPEDPNRYQAYYLEKETSELEGQKLAEYVKNQLDAVQKVGRSETLLLLLETGDEFVITSLIEEFQARFEEIDRRKVEMGMNVLQTVNELFLLGEMHFCNQVKQELLCPILVFALMLHSLKIKVKEELVVRRIVDYLMKWEKKCVELKMPAESIRLALRRLSQEGVQMINKLQGQANTRQNLNLINDINKDKIAHIDFDQTQLLLRLRDCKYIQLESSDHIVEKPNDVSKNSMDEPSHSSIKSYNKKSNFLEAYSKVPPNNNITPIKNNASEVKQIYFQHSNLSERFHQFQQSTPEDSNANHLLMSFKVPSPHFPDHSKSPQVVFSDSFTSNQKLSPTKQSKKYEENIQVIHEPSNTVQNSSFAEKSQKSEKISQKLVFNSSFDREVHDLKQQSNKRQASKMSEVSDYYKESIKQSADFAQPQTNEVKKTYLNEYMLPNKSSQIQSVKRSKQSSQRQPNSIYLVKSAEKKMSKSRSKKEGSLSSRVQNSKSIKVIHFNEAEKQGQQGYELRATSQKKVAAEVIKVEKTVLKPKFGFKVAEEETIVTETVEEQSVAKEINFTSKQESVSFYPSLSADSPLHFEEVPENFKDILVCKKERVKVNQFNHKAKELQMKIERMREKKARIQQEVKIRNSQIQKMKEDLPVPLNQLQQENKNLLKALKIKKQKSNEMTYEKRELKGAIMHISGSPLREQIKKQMLYLKCKLYHDENIEIGLQVKNKELGLYFTFLTNVDECAIRVEENSLKLAEHIDAKVYKVLQGKQIKFKSKIQNYTLFDNTFQLAKLKVDIRVGKNTKTQLLAIPYHLYNQLLFHPPSPHFNSNKSTDWHFSCQPLRESRHYVQDFLPHGKFVEGRYRTRIELKQNSFDYELVLEGQKFAIQYEERLQSEQIAILNTLISVFEGVRVGS